MSIHLHGPVSSLVRYVERTKKPNKRWLLLKPEMCLLGSPLKLVYSESNMSLRHPHSWFSELLNGTSLYYQIQIPPFYWLPATSGAGTTNLPDRMRSPFVFSWVRVDQSLVFCDVVCISLFVLFGLFWRVYCMSFDLWLLIALLLSSIFSYT